MKRTLILATTILGCLSVKAQSEASQEKPFFYDEFRLGTVFFSEGTPVNANLNYNFVLQKMQFLNHQDNNAILNLVRQPNLTHIEIGNDIFVPIGDQGFAHVIQDGPITLLKRKRVDVIRKRGEGAYGAPTSTSAVYTPTSLRTSTISGHQSVQSFNEFPPQTNYTVRTHFFLMKDNKVHSASRRNFLRIYDEVKLQLEIFLRENNVDFRNEQHLRSLTRYANNLLMARNQ